jgi:regulator of nucleoside diphosphate kinase
MPDISIIVADKDMDRLTRLVRAFQHSLFRDQQQLEMLDETLAAAEVRPSVRVPKDVIRMNSCIRVFDFDTQQKRTYTLTFPDEANISKGLISVLAPLGIALLGRRKGDVIRAQVPGGTRKLRVEGVRQASQVSRMDPSDDGATTRTKRTEQFRRSQEPALAV